MRAKLQKHTPQTDLVQGDLEFLIDLNHELCLLAEKINWKKFEQEFAGYFPATVGNPALPARLVGRESVLAIFLWYAVLSA